ncbi:MAG: hypothetical protein A4S09_01565 [Proteobacteria bacterium SG_bin7]|nr:MAG: hypothetical protein A4S09_01565 [Proteobacteria bacterium SG_bin7]
MSFQNQVAAKIKECYPGISATEEELRNIVKICTPHKISLRKSVLEHAKKFISLVFGLRRSEKYKKELGIFDPGNYSVLMAYDFHLTEDGELRLIEINTNGASSLLVDVLHRIHGTVGVSEEFQNSLKKSFINEFGRSSGRVCIIDENFKKQNSYVEFLMFQKLFEKWGYQAEVINPEEFKSADFIYNRLTDFYFSQEYSQKIKKAYDSKKTIVSPNPNEYHLLANKLRLRELCNEDLLTNKYGMNSFEASFVATRVPEVKSFSDFKDIDDLWGQRKKYFFKPVESFGAKGAFKGENISRKLFNELFLKNYIAQEFIRPPMFQDYKWDLRFYVYKDEIQLPAARLYKGQTTNFQEEGSGLAVVSFDC